VQAISSTTSFFVLFFGVILSLFFSNLAREEISIGSLMQKIIATTLVVAGVLLINMQQWQIFKWTLRDMPWTVSSDFRYTGASHCMQNLPCAHAISGIHCLHLRPDLPGAYRTTPIA
jgi:hypothetical protein